MINKNGIVIIGAGPAGLTAAWQLLDAGERNVTVIEADSQVGGISRTINHGGNRIDIGGHRFFSKSDWVMKWWASFMPLENAPPEGMELRYQGRRRPMPDTQAPAKENAGLPNTMLVRSRLSRIYYNRRFFDYPLKLNFDSLRKLGLRKTIAFGLSYASARLRPLPEENTLEQFFINRFGQKLYRQFFKEYTEKVWGVPCSDISAEWGAQRIKSLSIGKAVWQAARSALGLANGPAQQTSLIESFIYPKLGPGQMWEVVASKIEERGGKLLMNHRVAGLRIEDGSLSSVTVRQPNGHTFDLKATHVISTMPVKELVECSSAYWPAEIVDLARRLQYRDFITVGLLYRKADLPIDLKDNWIYIQEPGVQVGRVQVFNNWSPYMVADPDTVWLGLEFFCRDTDPLWNQTEKELQQLGQAEMTKIGLVTGRAIDAVVIRVPKAYPGYFGEAYEDFDRLRSALDAIPNLFLVGRNGMHRYNNQDHSMLTAKEAADQICGGFVDKSRIWAINVDDEYHEEASSPLPNENQFSDSSKSRRLLGRLRRPTSRVACR